MEAVLPSDAPPPATLSLSPPSSPPSTSLPSSLPSAYTHPMRLLELTWREGGLAPLTRFLLERGEREGEGDAVGETGEGGGKDVSVAWQWDHSSDNPHSLQQLLQVTAVGGMQWRSWWFACF